MSGRGSGPARLTKFCPESFDSKIDLRSRVPWAMGEAAAVRPLSVLGGDSGHATIRNSRHRGVAQW